MSYNFKYKVGDIVYFSRSKKYKMTVIKTNYLDDQHSYYEVEDLHKPSFFATPYIDAYLLESSSELDPIYLRKCKLKKLSNEL